MSSDVEQQQVISERIDGVRRVPLRGDVAAALGLSGAAIAGKYLVLGADEGHKLQVLLPDKEGTGWKLKRDITLARGSREVDIEAVTYGDGVLYAVGSHSRRRRRLKPESSSRKNRDRLLQTNSPPSRNRLYRMPFDPGSGRAGKFEKIDLSKRLRSSPLLKPFCAVPGKENGVDIEGIAYRRGLLWLGFRGPVLRDNYVPVMILSFDKPKRFRLRFVRLGGQGIRDMVAIDGGFLIVSGPVNDALGAYRLWWWDGKDQIPGKDVNVADTVLLGEISTPGGAKAEGLALLSQKGRKVDVLLVFETGTVAEAVRMRVTLPR